MGLTISHGCWEGSCRSFNFWRKALARAAGVDFPDQTGIRCRLRWLWLQWRGDPLMVLLLHADDGGEIEVKDCFALAARLEELLPQLRGLAPRVGDYERETRKFSTGLRRAAKVNENVCFM